MKGARVLATSAVAAALVLGGTSVAWAHHATLTHDIVCDTTSWTYTITEHVSNSEYDKVMTIVSAHGNPIIADGDTVAQGATRDYTLTGVTAPVDGTLTIDVSWPNGVTNTATDELRTSEFPACSAPTPTPTPTPTSTPTQTPSPTPTSTPPVGNPHTPTLPVTGAGIAGPEWWIGGAAAVVLGAIGARSMYKRRPKHRA